jgi:hypothetical protein
MEVQVMQRFLLVFAVLALVAAACGENDEAAEVHAPDDEEVAAYDIGDQPADAAATFVTPADGDTVTSPVAVEMAAEGVDIVPADAPAVGEAHFHILVDIGCAETGEFLPGPSDEAIEQGYYHFGDGSTETELDLEPGTYELCLQLADGVHAAYGQTDTIEITVE